MSRAVYGAKYEALTKFSPRDALLYNPALAINVFVVTVPSYLSTFK